MNHTSPDAQQAYAQGYHVGYQHGLEAAARASGNGQYPFNLVAVPPERSSRLLMFFFFVRGLALIPHMIILWFLLFGASLVMFIAWWAVVITGRYPRALWDYMVGVQRWVVRVQAFALGLTDQYPPFSFQ